MLYLRNLYWIMLTTLLASHTCRTFQSDWCDGWRSVSNKCNTTEACLWVPSPILACYTKVVHINLPLSTTIYIKTIFFVLDDRTRLDWGLWNDATSIYFSPVPAFLRPSGHYMLDIETCCKAVGGHSSRDAALKTSRIGRSLVLAID